MVVWEVIFLTSLLILDNNFRCDLFYFLQSTPSCSRGILRGFSVRGRPWVGRKSPPPCCGSVSVHRCKPAATPASPRTWTHDSLMLLVTSRDNIVRIPCRKRCLRLISFTSRKNLRIWARRKQREAFSLKIQLDQGTNSEVHYIF